MKRKPILLKKTMGKYHGMGREVIGLIGAHRGAGVTHTGLMLAFYLGEELGKKTAFLECNKHRDMELIFNAYEWSREEAYSFSFRKVTCYRDVTKQQIAEILGEDYECFILDLGADFIDSREEFLQCSTKIVISGRSEWDLQKLTRFVHATENLRASEGWLYFIPQANDKIVTKVKNEVKRKVWSIPYTEEPTIPSHNTNRVFREIF
jgi:hypothetical protein